MDTFRPRHTGFCFGVRDALQLTASALEDGAETVALGQVVHNQRAVDDLEQRGLRRGTELPLAGGPRVVITAHGATPQLFEEAQRRGLDTVDTTCPLVRRVQRHAQELSQLDLPVVIVGHAAHAEVKGVAGWAAAASTTEVKILDSIEQAAQLPWTPRRGVVCQSTFPQARFAEIVEELRKKSDELVVRDTTCPVVNQRHREAVGTLLDRADVVLVVGGKNSANTVALAETCAERVPTHHVESAAEIQPSWFRPGQLVGITSGTSTPSWVVDEVEARCRDI